MEIKSIHPQNTINSNSHNKTIINLNELFTELNTKQIEESIIQSINKLIDELNNASTEKLFIKTLLNNKNKILKIVVENANWVPKNYYRKSMLLFGMSIIGIPIGVSFGFLMKNMGLMGVGLPIGMGIGSIIGVSKDKKALAENRQLQTEI